MPAPVQPQPGASVIPPNSDLQDLIQQSIANSGAAPPVRQSAPMNQQIPGVHTPVTVQGNGQQPMQSAPPARNAQQDWFAQMGTGEDPDASMDFSEPAAPQRFQQPAPQAPRQFQAPPQAHQIPEMAEIDALLQEVPQQGAPEAPVQQQQWQQPQVPAQQLPAQAPPPAVDPQELQTRAINELMGREYAIPEADARRLISEPEAILPRLAATVHVNAVRDIGRVIQQTLPRMIAEVVAGEVRAIRAESEFFGRYPQLNRPDFKPFVENGIKFARQSNPSGDRETLMREGATYAAMLIKRSYRPQVPAAPQGRAPVAPYTPAAAYGGPPVPQNPNGNGQSGNIFTDLGNDPDLFNF